MRPFGIRCNSALSMGDKRVGAGPSRIDPEKSVAPLASSVLDHSSGSKLL